MDKIAELFESAAYETRQGDIDKAIENYQEIIKRSRPNEQARHLAHWGIGEIYLNTRDYEKAEHHLLKAIWLAPDVAHYHYLLGCTYTYTNEIDKAIVHLEKAVHLDQSQDIFWDQLGWVVGYNRDFEKGIEYLKKSLSINPHSTKALQDICMLYAKNFKFGEAMICIEEAQELEPDNAEIERIKRDLESLQGEFNSVNRKDSSLNR